MTLTFPMTQALLAGDPRIGAHVVVQHPHDSKAINNRGSQTVFSVFTTDVGRNLTFEFPVVNDSGAARTITLALLPNNLSAAITPAVHNFAPWEQILARVTAHVPGEHARHARLACSRRHHGDRMGNRRSPDRRCHVCRESRRLMGIMVKIARLLFGRLSFCALNGALIGALAGFLFGALLLEHGSHTFTPAELLQIALLLTAGLLARRSGDRRSLAALRRQRHRVAAASQRIAHRRAHSVAQQPDSRPGARGLIGDCSSA